MKLITYRNRLFPFDFFRPFETELDSSMRSPDRTFFPSADIHDEEKQFRISIEIPGVSPENVEVNVEENILSIRGEKLENTHKDDTRIHLRERRSGRFERLFRLPETVDVDHVRATFENGLLEVLVPKKEAATPKRIEVKMN